MAQPQPGGAMPQLQPGQQPTPDQIRQMQAQLAAEAQKAGMTVPQYVEKLKAQAMQQHQARQAQQQQQQKQNHSHSHGHGHHHGHQHGAQVPSQPGPPKPEALALAKFLRSQDLKPRTCIFQEERKDMFRVKRAIRALQSEAYVKARQKNPLLPAVKDRASAEETFKLLPMSLLALRVSKADPNEGHEGHGHAAKRVKGLWTVRVEQEQEANDDDYHYMWLYQGAQWKNKLYAVGALILILAIVFFPVWPDSLRMGSWYLSMGMLGLLGLFFLMAIFRGILFLITMFTNPPGLWLYPNLFEDVGFFDSFRPLWAWHEDEKAVKKRKKQERDAKKAKKEGKANGEAVVSKKKRKGKTEESDPSISVPVTTSATGSESVPADGKMGLQQRNLSASVEEADDE